MPAGCTALPAAAELVCSRDMVSGLSHAVLFGCAAVQVSSGAHDQPHPTPCPIPSVSLANCARTCSTCWPGGLSAAVGAAAAAALMRTAACLRTTVVARRGAAAARCTLPQGWHRGTAMRTAAAAGAVQERRCCCTRRPSMVAMVVSVAVPKAGVRCWQG